jgi:hypothetical protein
MLSLGFAPVVGFTAALLKVMVFGSIVFGIFVCGAIVRALGRWFHTGISSMFGFRGPWCSRFPDHKVVWNPHGHRRARHFHPARQPILTTGYGEAAEKQARQARAPAPPPREARRPNLVALGVSQRRHRNPIPVWSVLVIGLVIFGLIGVVARVKKEEAQREPAQVVGKRAVANSKKESTRRESPRRQPLAATAAATPAWSPLFWEAAVHGVGVTLEDAKRNALKNAALELTDFLQEQTPPIEWVPSPEFVWRQLKLDWSEDKVRADPDLVEIHEVELKVEATGKDRDQILQHARHFRVEQRMVWLGWILGGMVLVLAGIAGYIRVDEWSKGYYAAWLRIAAVSFLAAVASGVWLWTHW